MWARLSPIARVKRALSFGDFSKTIFVVLCVFLDRPFYFTKEAAIKFFLGHSVADKKQSVCFSPVFAILPNLDWIAAHLLRQFKQSGILSIVTITQKDLVVEGS